MGVTGLWTILHPCARPIKLETLNRKRLAVDASIWIYQFLKAVRDKEGNALRNSHVVGFFRRICKLLFFGIKPVFVFDGGAPALKRQTVSERKKRREGRREDAVRTAGKLLAVQMQRRAEEEEQKRRDEDRHRAEVEEELPDNLVYADENMMSAQERQQNRRFKKKDQYHLPELDVSMNEMGGPNDPRVMSLEELQTYARQFDTGEDINVYDFSKIDYDSPFFTSLPASDRYNILNAARLRSRLRMGHSKEQLDSMFPDRMAFSKFQIERVRERNELTQRLMHVNEGGDTAWDGGRIAGEKGREYVLVKNDGVEGGWALGVIGGDEGTKEETAIDIDRPAPEVREEDDDWEDDDGFEDIPIEGLNRLPKRPNFSHDSQDAYAKQRRAFYKSRGSGAKRKPKAAADPNSLFVQDEPADEQGLGDWEEVDADGDLFGEGAGDEEDEELNKAIAMSLQNDELGEDREASNRSGTDDEDMLEAFQQSAVQDARPVPQGSARAIANIMNKRAHDTAPESREVTSFGVPQLRDDDSDEDDTMDLQAALAESRRSKRKASPPQRKQPPKPKQQDAAKDVAKKAGFSGPLPFEKLDLGSSLLGKKKMKERTEDIAGGFENPELSEKQKKAEPLPPWFSGDLENDIQKQRNLESEDRQRAKEFNRQFQFQSKGEPKLRRNDTNEVIDLDADDDAPTQRNEEVIELEDGDKDEPEGDGDKSMDDQIRMGDMADKVHIEPPVTEDAERRRPSTTEQTASTAQPFEMDESDEELSPSKNVARADLPAAPSDQPAASSRASEKPTPGTDAQAYTEQARTSDEAARAQAEDEDEDLPWSESEDEGAASKSAANKTATPTIHQEAAVQSRSPSADFEDVEIPDRPASSREQANDSPGIAPASGVADQNTLPDDIEEAEFDDFSDPEDEELLHQLTVEAEEHARFASTLNNKTQAQNVAEYEKELKQLRNQQKKDRRDADEVTHIMIQECQQLLRLFGLPYVTAPMEAEAQCAELVSLGLVDGIVTDDSDCFLFGGTRIYKNMFNQAKFVECYLASDLEKEFDLTRDKMVAIAHLLGSDYTEGLPGIGPVTALEILGEFPDLEEFKTWWSGVQMNTIPKSDDKSNAFRKKFRKNATKLFLPPNFPDARVSIAYNKPEVDSDPSPFEWGVPDLDALRNFLMATIGWSQERTDEVLVPVIRDMNRRADEGTQSNITAFFEGGVGIGAAGATKASARGEAFAPRKRVQESSKRMGSALTRLAEKARGGRSQTEPEPAARDEAAEPDDDAPASASRARKKTNSAKRAKRAADPALSGSGEGDDSEFEVPRKRQKKRAARTRKNGDADPAL